MAFGLTVVWAHPHQAHLPSLDEVARKLSLLINIGNNWVYAFVWLNKGALHVPLSSEGHINAMIDGVPSRSTCGHLHQLQVQRLLQCRSYMMCPEGLNGGARASAALHPTTTHVGYKYPLWACLQAIAALGGPPLGNAG